MQDGPFLDYAGIPSVNKNAFLFEVKRVSIREGTFFRVCLWEQRVLKTIRFSQFSPVWDDGFSWFSFASIGPEFSLEKQVVHTFQYSGRAGKLLIKFFNIVQIIPDV